MLTFRTLGALHLDGPDGELLRGRRKELALLAYLARRGTPATREELADAFWGSRPDANARQSLRQALLRLKRAVPEGLDTEGDSVALPADTLALDANQFEGDLDAGRLEDAVGRWHGDFLAGLDDVGSPAFGAWLEAQRQGLRARLQTALVEIAARAEREGDTAAALRWSERWAELFPYDEQAATRVIHLLERSGRTGEARGRHAAFLSRLRRDLDVEPTAGFLALMPEPAPANAATRPTPASGALFTPDFVGRQSAIEALDRAWKVAAGGTTTLVLVEGDEGIGKTRLCEEFVRTLPPGAVRLRARGREADGETAYATIREALGALADAPGLAGAGPGALAAVSALVPVLRARFPTAAAAAPHPALADALAEVLAAVAAEASVLLLIDDFPLADRGTRDLVLALAHRVRQSGLCILLTSRSDDAPPELLAELRGRVGEARIRLAPLAEDAVEGLLGSMLEMTPAVRRQMAGLLYAESGGNPLYLIETTAALLDEGRLTADGRGIWHPTAALADERLPVPPTVRAAARRRIRALSPEAGSVAAAVAVLGGLATMDRLALVAGLPADDVEAALEELHLRRVVRAPAGSGPAYEFVHDVSRRAALGTLAGTRRRRLHHRAYRALRTARAADTASVPPEALAYHRHRAGLLGGRLPPWMGARVGAALAGVVILTVLGVWMEQRSGTGFVERDSIVLADLDNATGDSVFDESLTAALFVAISQSQYVNVYPPARVRETLQRMQRGDAPRLTEPLAREVAQREGIRAVVTLALTRSEDRYTLTSRIVDPGTGRGLATLSAEAQGRDRVLPALDALAADLRKRLGESAREIRERSVPLPQATTASLDALKAFGDGMRAMDEGRTRDAITALDAAIALDSGFAWAHAALGRYLVWMNVPVDAEPYLERALALADRLPPRERMNVEWTVARGRQDRVTAVKLAREYLRQYPDDRDAWFALGRSLQEAGDWEGALEAYRRELAMDPNASGALENSALLYGLTGRPREAAAAFERGMTLDSSLVTQIAGDRNRIYGFVLLSLGDTARARATFTLLLPGNPAQRANGLRSLALLEAYQGRYRRAADWLTQAIRLNQEGGSTVSELRNRLHLAGMYRTASRDGDARAQLRRALAIQESAPALPLTWLGFLAQQLARTGMLAEADRVVAVIEGHRQLRGRRDSVWLALARAEVALARSDAATAAAGFASRPAADDRNYLRQGFARALAAVGRLDEATGAYQAMLRDSALGDEAQEPWVLAHYELAVLYDALGDSAAALPLYRRLAEQWRSGDADLPILQAIRRRLGSGG